MSTRYVGFFSFESKKYLGKQNALGGTAKRDFLGSIYYEKYNENFYKKLDSDEYVEVTFAVKYQHNNLEECIAEVMNKCNNKDLVCVGFIDIYHHRRGKVIEQMYDCIINTIEILTNE